MGSKTYLSMVCTPSPSDKDTIRSNECDRVTKADHLRSCGKTSRRWAAGEGVGVKKYAPVSK